MSTWLGDTCLSKLTVVLINGCLHLFEDSVDGGQVTTGFGITHRGKAVALQRIIAVVASDATGHCSDGLIGGDG